MSYVSRQLDSTTAVMHVYFQKYDTYDWRVWVMSKEINRKILWSEYYIPVKKYLSIQEKVSKNMKKLLINYD